MNNLKSKIMEAISKVNKEISNVSHDDNYVDRCNIDSLGLIIIVSTLESEFDIFIINEDFNVEAINTINKLYNYVSAQIEMK